METVQPAVQPRTTSTHPVVIAAAASLIVLSALGSAALLGWLPRSATEPVTGISQTSGSSGPSIVTPATVATPAPVVASAPAVARAAPAPAPAPRVVARAETRPATRSESRPAVRETVEPYYEEPAYERPAERTTSNRRNDEDRYAQNDRYGQTERYPQTDRYGQSDTRDIGYRAPTQVAAPVCKECGVIASVNEIEKVGDGSGLGAVAGGVVGAIAGKQVGGGRGRNVMSVLGAVGGAYAGHQIEKNAKKVKIYEITVRFDDGTTQTLSQSTPPAWRTGDRVRMVNGSIQSNA